VVTYYLNCSYGKNYGHNSRATTARVSSRTTSLTLLARTSTAPGSSFLSNNTVLPITKRPWIYGWCRHLWQQKGWRKCLRDLVSMKQSRIHHWLASCAIDLNSNASPPSPCPTRCFVVPCPVLLHRPLDLPNLNYIYKQAYTPQGCHDRGRSFDMSTS